MRSRKYLVYIVILLLIGAAVGLYVSTKPAATEDDHVAGPMQIMTTTSLLECAVKEIGGEHVRVGVLIAPGSCPGHYDIRPEDMKTLCASKILFTHGYEGFVPRMLESAGRQRPKEVAISVDGNWMIPSVYISALTKVADVLCESDSAHSEEYKDALVRLQDEYKKLEEELKSQLEEAGADGVPALCSDQQADVAKWMGLKVVDIYPRAEQFTPVLLHHMTDIGQKNQVKICVDNLQSGPTAGLPLAKDLGATHVTISNFPGGFADTDTWKECAQDNVRRVIKSLKSNTNRKPSTVNRNAH
ncbi:MAG: metal ABC transporter substrate-binding protein [Armatimonadota bacterium]|jgi:ABC-type Zn uptake system ZnuABC Zn-binding protein ZnuA